MVDHPVLGNNLCLSVGGLSHMTPSMWSMANPRLQIAWDATSLSSLMKCPRRYQYEIIEGWRGSGVDLEFGGYFASAVETYKKERLNGRSKSEATIEALKFVLSATWVQDTPGPPDGSDRDSVSEHSGSPWGGRYELQWHCLGTEPYKNGKGNRAKCPWSLKGRWHPGNGPSVCGECGSGTETAKRWLPGDKYKDRYSLIRLVVWYCDEQAEILNESPGLSPVKFPDGTNAVELSFAIPTPWRTASDETYILAGHMDSISALGAEHFTTDNKSTKKPLDEKYWSQYSPNVQVDLYDLVGNLLYPQLNLRGVAIEGAQVLTGGARFAVKPMYRTEAQREEFWHEIEWWLKQAERYATENYWPMNRTACFLCPFKGICSKEPASRQMYLEGNFQKRHWNPLEER